MEFFKPAWQSDDTAKAEKAVNRERNQAKIAKIAQEATCHDIRIMALNKLTDQSIIESFVKNNTDLEMRLTAIMKLAAPNVYAVTEIKGFKSDNCSDYFLVYGKLPDNNMHLHKSIQYQFFVDIPLTENDYADIAEGAASLGYSWLALTKMYDKQKIKQLANNRKDAKPFERLRIAKWIEDPDWVKIENNLIYREEIDKIHSLVADFIEACEGGNKISIARAETALSALVEKYVCKQQQPEFAFTRSDLETCIVKGLKQTIKKRTLNDSFITEFKYYTQFLNFALSHIQDAQKLDEVTQAYEIGHSQNHLNYGAFKHIIHMIDFRRDRIRLT